MQLPGVQRFQVPGTFYSLFIGLFISGLLNAKDLDYVFVIIDFFSLGDSLATRGPHFQGCLS